MQAASLLLTPLIMSGADMLFSTLQNDKYLAETKRQNNRMFELEQSNVEWSQKYELKQRELNLRAERKNNAKNLHQEDLLELNELVLERKNIKNLIVQEQKLKEKNNPYFLTSDLVVTGGLVFGAYKLIKYLC